MMGPSVFEQSHRLTKILGVLYNLGGRCFQPFDFPLDFVSNTESHYFTIKVEKYLHLCFELLMDNLLTFSCEVISLFNSGFNIMSSTFQISVVRMPRCSCLTAFNRSSLVHCSSSIMLAFDHSRFCKDTGKTETEQITTWPSRVLFTIRMSVLIAPCYQATCCGLLTVNGRN